MTEDNHKCKVCGEKFEEKEDLTAHGKDNHPVFTESYAKENYGIGGRPKNEDDRAKDLYEQFDEQDISHVDELVDQGTDRTDAITKVAKDAGYESKCDDCGADYDNQYVLDKHQKAEGHEEETFGDYEVDCDCDKDPDCPKCGGKGSNTWTSTVYQGDEIEQQKDKPVQSHDDWQKELEGLKDEFSTEQVEDNAVTDVSHDYMKSLKDQLDKTEDTGEDSEQKGFSYQKGGEGDIEDYEDSQQDEDRIADDEQRKEYGEEDGGADDPLKKVADLSENYRFLSKDVRVKIFESLGLTQGDASILAGLQWNELTRPIRVEASEAYSKEDHLEREQEEKLERYGRVNEPEEDEDKVYENFYNLEKNHSSPDFKKKAIECNRCNERFYKTVDRDIHFNEVHATEDSYQLPEECPFCKIEIPEGQDLDYHMSTAHGAHVPSDYTQTGVDAGMSDANWDRIEYAGASRASERLDRPTMEVLDIISQGGDLKYYEDKIPYLETLGLVSRELGTNKPILTPKGYEEYQNRYDETTGAQQEYDVISGKLRDFSDDGKGFLDPTKYTYDGAQYGESKRKANEISRPITDKEAMLMYDKPWDELTHEEKLIMHGIFADESRVKGKESRVSEIKKEIKRLQNIIQVASEENPLHMYLYNDKIDELKIELTSLGESRKKSNEDGMYSNFGKKDNDDSWTVLTVGSDLLFFNSREEAEDYTKNMPSGTYSISPPKSGKESYAKESNMDQWWWKEVKWESGFDQDFLYCNHCGADLYAEASWVEPLNNVGDDKMNRVVPDHLRSHGINESYSKETLHGDTNKEGLFYWKPTNEWLEGHEWDLRDIVEDHPKVEESYAKEVGTEMCTCGHLGGSTEPSLNKHEDRFQQGHGGCKICGPEICPQFTWTTMGNEAEAEEIVGAVGMGARAVVGAGAKAGTNVAGRIAGDEEDENKCENCEREEEFLNDDGLCEDCEREAGIDRKESERDAYD